MTHEQVNEADWRISTRAEKSARIFFGFMKPKKELEGNARITVIATGIKETIGGKKGIPFLKNKR